MLKKENLGYKFYNYRIGSIFRNFTRLTRTLGVRSALTRPYHLNRRKNYQVTHRFPNLDFNPASQLLLRYRCS